MLREVITILQQGPLQPSTSGVNGVHAPSGSNTIQPSTSGVNGAHASSGSNTAQPPTSSVNDAHAASRPNMAQTVVEEHRRLFNRQSVTFWHRFQCLK